MRKVFIFHLLLFCGLLGCTSPLEKGGERKKRGSKFSEGERGGASYSGLTFLSSRWSGDNGGLQKRHALLVGVDKYRYHPGWNLPFVKNNVRELKKTLIKSLKFSPENIYVITGEQATREYILDSIENYFQSKIRGKDNLFLFYYSGHGFISVKSKEQNFLTYLSAASSNRRFTNTLRDSDIKKSLLILKKNLQGQGDFESISILDACQSPGMAPAAFSPKVVKLSEAMLTSCQPGQFAMPNSEATLSAFTEKLCETLEKKSQGNQISVKSLYQSLSRSMKDLSHQPTWKGKNLELFSRKSIPVEFRAYSAAESDQMLSASLKINDSPPLALPVTKNLSQGEYFLEISHKGYFTRTEKVSIGPEHRGQIYKTYLSPRVFAVRGKISSPSGVYSPPLAISVAGSFDDFYKEYHQNRVQMEEGGKFQLILPPFEGLRYLLVSQGKKVLVRRKLTEKKSLEMGSREVSGYFVGKIEIQGAATKEKSSREVEARRKRKLSERKDRGPDSRVKKRPRGVKKIKGFSFSGFYRTSLRGVRKKVARYIHNRTGLEFLMIPGGTFKMGEVLWSASQPRRKVKIEPFLICRTEVTQKAWVKIMNSRPWAGKKKSASGDSYPATHISWFDARSFCQKTGLRLPSESQWEYACRGGTSTLYYWGSQIDFSYLWYKANSSGPQKVAQKKPNPFGLYDMSGNLWEWCADNWHSNYSGAPKDGQPWYGSSSSKVCRGGSWNDRGISAASGFRTAYSPDVRWEDIGFRPVAILEKEK